MQMTKHSQFPFEFKDWDSIGDMECGYYNVIVTGPFGELSIGQEFDFVSIDYFFGELKVWDKDEEEPILTIKFGVVAL